ncbi:MAG: hypothetical protein ACE5EV_09535 [Gaiellales bacterium]
MISEHLGHPCVGLRTPFGYYRGLCGRPDLLEVVREAGIRYVSSWLRNEHEDNPTPWVQPFAYADDGFDDILEIPAQFWLDAIWFDRHGWDRGPGYLDALRSAVDHIAENDLVYGACFHEWAVLSANERRTGWLRGFIEYALERDVEITTYTDYWRRQASGAGWARTVCRAAAATRSDVRAHCHAVLPTAATQSGMSTSDSKAAAEMAVFQRER